MSIFTINGSPVKYGNRWLANGGTPSSELPPYDSSDAGKALVVNNEGDNVEWQIVGSSGVVDQHYDGTSTNAQSGTAVAQAVSGVDAVPDVTSSDNGKVLVATYSGGTGSYAWASAPPANAIILDRNSTWDDFHTPYSAGRKDIYYKHTSPYSPIESRAELYLHLTAVSDVDGTSTNFTFALFEGAWNSSGVDYSVRCKFRYSGGPLVFLTSWVVDQSYSSSSSHAQSGTAVAEAISRVSQVPSSTQTDANKVLTVNGQGIAEWATPSGGTTYTQGNMISLANNQIAVSTAAGITDIQFVNALPANPVATVLYLIPTV